MAAKFDSLFSLSFGHDYFGNEGYGSFKISPTAETQNAFLRMGYIFKVDPKGFRVLYDAQFQGNTRTREEALKSDVALVFNITNGDPNFLTFTGLIGDNPNIDVRKNIFCFTNQPLGTNSFRNSLQENEAVGPSEMFLLSEYPETFFLKPFGQIRIVLNQGLEKIFKINFAANYTHWRYLLASNFLKSLNSPAIINKDTGEIFIGPESLSISGQVEVLAFYSPKPIMSTAKPNKSFQLVENYEPDSGKYRVVYSMLPNPIPGSISSLPGVENGKIKFSEIFL